MIVKLKRSTTVLEKGIPVLAVLLEIRGLIIVKSDDYLNTEFETTIRETAEAFTTETIAKDKIVALIRAMFKSFGTDPTRWRPSSEAMIRRAVKEKSLYKINSLIDINNIVSMRYRLPIGVYDMDRIAGDVVILDIGCSGEEFTGLTGRTYNAENKPILRDGEGIFGSPVVDSERTKITDITRNAAAVIFSHIDEPVGHCINAAEEYARLARRVHTGVTVTRPVKAE